MKTRFRIRTVDQLTIDDERSFRHVGLYADLKEILRKSKYPFRVLHGNAEGRWDQALVLNLTFWGANAGGDVLVDDHLDADVVTHAAWHHLAATRLSASDGALSADALFLGEAIASAFDLYLVGRMLGHADDSGFLQSQVPAMADAADAAGLAPDRFEALLGEVADAPEQAFEDLRSLLWDATTRLVQCPTAEAAFDTLSDLETHRLAPLLYRYELSNWVLFARAYASDRLAPDPKVRDCESAMRGAPDSLDWLEREWVAPALAGRVTGA
jgi:hypothetical protein